MRIGTNTGKRIDNAFDKSDKKDFGICPRVRPDREGVFHSADRSIELNEER
ncbi:MAG: hypothetical protein IKJ32_02535 [Clostridia bacterium]|nr:hypothetical protein [Clostridia bacterium]